MGFFKFHLQMEKSLNHSYLKRSRLKCSDGWLLFLIQVSPLQRFCPFWYFLGHTVLPKFLIALLQRANFVGKETHTTQQLLCITHFTVQSTEANGAEVLLQKACEVIKQTFEPDKRKFEFKLKLPVFTDLPLAPSFWLGLGIFLFSFVFANVMTAGWFY